MSNNNNSSEVEVLDYSKPMKIRFLRDYFTFISGQEIKLFQNKFNIIVGNNGAGKTTLLNTLSSKRRREIIGRYIEIEDMKKQNVLILSSESFRASKNPFVDSRREVYLTQLNQKSHGEAWKVELERLKTRCNNDTFIIMDEPETALSVESQIELCEWFIALKNQHENIGCAISTHSLILMELIGERVLEVPSGKEWLASDYVANKYARIKEAKSYAEYV
jgi:predicted ATPase